METWSTERTLEDGKILKTTYELLDPLPPTPTFKTLYGTDFEPDEVADHVRDFPGSRYHRVFGGNNLPPLDRGKMQELPPEWVPHVSWNVWGPPETLWNWLDVVRRPIWLSFKHEPRKKIEQGRYSLEEWQDENTAMIDVVRRHPNGALVQRMGPIVTNWTITNPAGGLEVDRFWLPFADSGLPQSRLFLGVDTYNDRTFYRTPDQLFRPGSDTAMDYDVAVAYPEWGGARVESDLDGMGHAEWMAGCIDEITNIADEADESEAGNVAAIAWWSIGGCNLMQEKLVNSKDFWQTFLAVQA
jgi:hypothetical protein